MDNTKNKVSAATKTEKKISLISIPFIYGGWKSKKYNCQNVGLTILPILTTGAIVIFGVTLKNYV